MFHRPNPQNQNSNPQSVQGEDKTMNANTPNENENSEARSVDIPAGNNPFQRPQAAAPGARPVPAYGAYPAYGSSNPLASTSNGRRLVIGPGITMSGEIESCDNLVVEGTVEAALKGASVLEISESGMFYGTVEINEATIAGKFEGELTVNGRLTIRASGSVIGAISYKELAVEAGATIDGKISPVGGSRAGSNEKRGSKPSKAQGEELPILQRASGQ